MKIKTKFYLLNIFVLSIIIIIILLCFFAGYKIFQLERTISRGFNLIAEARSIHGLLKDIIFDMFNPQMYNMLLDLTYSPSTPYIIKIWIEKEDEFRTSFKMFLNSKELKSLLNNSEMKVEYDALMNITNKVYIQIDELEKTILDLQSKGIFGQEKFYFKLQNQNDENRERFFIQVRTTSYYITNTFESYLNYFILSLKEQAAALQWMIIISLLIIILITGFLVLLAGYLISKNISDKILTVKDTVKLISKGDFSAHFQIDSNDEFKDLFVNMNLFFNKLKNNINSVLNLMHHVGMSINFSLKYEDLIDIICKTILNDVDLDGIIFIQLNNNENNFEIKNIYGKYLKKFSLLNSKYKIKTTFIEDMEKIRSPVFIKKIKPKNNFNIIKIDYSNIKSLIIMPIIINKDIKGILFTFTLKSNREMNDLDFFKLQTFSEYASLLIDNYNKYKELLEKKEAEYMALQFQVQPHFLYNIMNNLIGLNRKGEKQILEDSIFALKDMMRYTTKRIYWTSIKEEFDFLEKYLKIQKVRFGERLKYNVICEKNTEQIKIPKLLLQPIVENAVIHGIEPLKNNGFITIHSRIINNKNKKKLYVSIKDNGVGFDTKKINFKKNIGINNVEERIKLIFPKAYYKIKSMTNSGTEFLLNIPYEDLKIS